MKIKAGCAATIKGNKWKIVFNYDHGALIINKTTALDIMHEILTQKMGISKCHDCKKKGLVFWLRRDTWKKICRKDPLSIVLCLSCSQLRLARPLTLRDFNKTHSYNILFHVGVKMGEENRK